MSLTKLKRQIVELETKGELDKVIGLIEDAIEEHSNEGTLFNKLGDLYVKKKRIDDAIDIYIKGVEAFTNEAYYSNAIALCKKILRYNKDRLEVYRHLGELHGELGQKGEAANYYLQYADKKFDDGDTEAALDSYLHIKELLPNNPRVAERIADIYKQVGKEDEANALYEEAISIYESSGDGDKAAEIKKKIGAEAVATKEPSKEVDEEVAEVSIDSLVSPEVAALLDEEEEAVEQKPEEEVAEKPKEGLEKAEEAEKVAAEEEEEEEEKVDTVNKTVELAELYLSLDRKDEAIECFSNAAEQTYKNKDYQKARELYQRVSGLRPVDLKVRQRLIEVAKRTKDKRLEVDTMIELTQLLLQREAKSQAKKLLKRILEIEPDNATARDILGEIEEKEKEFIDLGDLLREEMEAEEPARLQVGDLVEEFRKEVFESIGESDFKSHYDLGVAYKEMGLYSEAVEEFGISLKDNELRLKSMEMIATCYYERKKYKEAITIIKKALKIPEHNDSDFIGVHLLMARCFESLNQVKKAVREYEIVYRQDPSLVEVKDKLAALKKSGKKKEKGRPKEKDQKSKAKKKKVKRQSKRKGRISYI